MKAKRVLFWASQVICIPLVIVVSYVQALCTWVEDLLSAYELWAFDLGHTWYKSRHGMYHMYEDAGKWGDQKEAQEHQARKDAGVI